MTFPPHASSACESFHQTGVTRRHALKVGGLGLLGLTMPGLLRAEALNKGPRARARSVIFLFQFGGPSQVDMFDMKPDAPEGVRGPHRPMSTNVPGVQITEHLPELAKVMDKVTLIRSMHHSMKNHNSASYYALTGHEPPVDDIRLRDSLDLFPAYGSVVDRLAPVHGGELPTSVAYPHVIRDGSVTPGQHASFLGKEHDPFLVTQDPNQPDFHLPELSLPTGLSYERLSHRRELQQLIDQQSRLIDYSATAQGLDAYYQKALAMLNSDRLRNAFNLGAEPEAIRERYGRHTYGQSCLLARRLVEAGTKFVTVYYSSSIGGQSKTSGGWDTHGFNNTRMYPIIEDYHLPMTNQTLPTLLQDLDQRGLLDTTLVVWMGEFGRTPMAQGDGRDHHIKGFSVWMAGGGVQGGVTHGNTDELGYNAVENVVPVHDYHATILHLLGIEHKKLTYPFQGRDFRLTDVGGHVVRDLLA
jgi:hypothetical protein